MKDGGKGREEFPIFYFPISKGYTQTAAAEAAAAPLSSPSRQRALKLAAALIRTKQGGKIEASVHFGIRKLQVEWRGTGGQTALGSDSQNWLEILC